jgi:hypothetical protein
MSSDETCVPHEFATLARILGDLDGVRRVVASFYRTTMTDLVALEHAAAHGHWSDVRRLAHRIALGCMQVGAHASAQGLLPLRDVHGDLAARALFFGVFGQHRWRLIETLEHAADFVFGANPVRVSGTPPGSPAT